MAPATPLPDFDAMRRAIDEAGRDALNPDAENRVALFEGAFQEVRGIRADAIKWRRFFRRNPEVRRKAKETRGRAERRLGQLLDAMKEAAILTDGRPTKGNKISRSVPSGCLTLEMLGTHKGESHQWQNLAKMSDAEFEAWLADARSKTAGPRSSPGVKIHRIALSSISISHRIRALRPEAVDAMAGSMRDQGQLSPIMVRPEGNGYELVIGHHRYEAALKLGWKEIGYISRKGLDAVKAELCEIDENLIRAELTPAEQAAHHARRKALYEQKHPETKHGGDRKSDKSSRQNGDLNDRYTKNTAKKTGNSERKVQRNVARGENIPDVAELAGTSLDKGDELDALAKLKEVDPERQSRLIDQAKGGEKVSAKAELKEARRKNDGHQGEATPTQPQRVGSQEQLAAESEQAAEERKAFYASQEESDVVGPDPLSEMGEDDPAWERQEAVREAHLRASGVLDDIIEFSRRLQSCLKSEVWKYDRIDRQRSYGPMTFSEFLHLPYPAGLGIDYATLRWLLDGATLSKSPDRSVNSAASLCEHLRCEIDRLESEAGEGANNTVEEEGIMNDVDQRSVAAE